MKKVFKFVKGKKDEKKEIGGIASSQSGDLVSLARTPEDEAFLGLDGTSGGYAVDFGGRDKTLTKLHKAAWLGNLEKLKSALKKVEVDAVDRYNRTALHFAVVQGHPNIVWFLLGNNAATEICDEDGFTPLLKAIECGHKECFKLLLERGADANANDHSGNSCLHLAVRQNSLEMVAALLSKNVNLKRSNNAGDHPLHVATKSENKDLVVMLLNAGAEINILDRENRTPLMLAAKNGNNALIDIFIGRGATSTLVDSNGWKAEDYALLGGHEAVASTLKNLFREKNEKVKGINSEDKSKWEDLDEANDGKSEESNKSEANDSAQMKLNEIFRNCLKEEVENSEKEKEEETTESPSAQIIPPYCHPPRSWDFIQAGMIGSTGTANRHGTKTKKLNLTSLVTEEFTTIASSTSPKYTLSLNRRKNNKINNSFAKQRFSLNEEMSLKILAGEKEIKETDDKFKKAVNSEEVCNASNLHSTKPETVSPDASDWDSDISKPKSLLTNPQTNPPLSSSDWDSTEGEEGTLGRSDTMKDFEEIWVNSSKAVNFPPPPSALELGVDMAKSWKFIKGVSEDAGTRNEVERNLWKKRDETHSLDRLEEKNQAELARTDSLNDRHSFLQKSVSPEKWVFPKEILKCQKSTDKAVDENDKINEQLECYDQALRELAETSTEKNAEHFAYQKTPNSSIPNQDLHHSPSNMSENDAVVSGDRSQSLFCDNKTVGTIGQSENNEKLGLEEPRTETTTTTTTTTSTSTSTTLHKEQNNESYSGGKIKTEGTDRKTKRDILMAMRDVKHAIHVPLACKTSIDDQILSPLAKPEDELFGSNESSPKDNRKQTTNTIPSGSPVNGAELFASKRQETVLERKISGSESDEEPTLWFHKGLQENGSNENVLETLEKQGVDRSLSFSPLGIIFNEIQNENLNATKCPTESNSSKVKKISEVNEDSKKEKLWFQSHYQIPDDVSPRSNDKDNDDDNQKDNVRDVSPDISLSSGPIEPLGVEKDSGSDPESSHNDVSPNHRYTLKDQHEWLKHHLKAAMSEKNKLEEMAARLSEKSERLQYELADAKEATKSKDEVIKLLQEQLSRMETAYTKSLEDSVQSRLQLTSHEQEILHLKEICYKYEEEKSKEVAEAEAQHIEKMEIKIKRLEKEKEKMKEEILQLENERKILAKRLKEATESELLDQCQRWKERCAKEERKIAETIRAKLQNDEVVLGEQNVRLKDENDLKLISDDQKIVEEVESKNKLFIAKKQIDETIEEMKKKNLEMESYVEQLEKDFKVKMENILKEKEKEIQNLMRRFDGEKEFLVKTYEKKFEEWKFEKCNEEKCRKEVKRLKEIIRDLRDRVLPPNYDKNFHFLLRENANLKKAINEIKIDLHSEGLGSGKDSRDKSSDHLVHENIKMKSIIWDLKDHVNALSLALMEKEREKRTTINRSAVNSGSSEYLNCSEEKRKNSKPKTEREQISDETTKLFDIRSKCEEMDVLKEKEEKTNKKEIVCSGDALELAKLKREIGFLRNKMADEIGLREALENQMSEINKDIKEKETLQSEIQFLKKKINKNYIEKFNFELSEYQKELQSKRESYMENEDDCLEIDKNGGLFGEDYKKKCKILAKEREKTKELKTKIWWRNKSFDFSNQNLHSKYAIFSNKQPENSFRFNYDLSKFPLTLEPEIKNLLEKELVKSIRRYKGTATTSMPSSSSSSFFSSLVEQNENCPPKSV